MPEQVVSRVGVAILAACAAGATCLVFATPASAGGRELNLTFDDSRLTRNSGSAPVTVEEVTANGGQVNAVSDPSGGRAIRLPGHESTGYAPRAVLTVTQQDNALSPGTASFRFGADFTLDAESQGSASDNGNNLLQRGLWDAPMQYKVQVDGGRPSCRVKGSRGAVDVVSPRRVEPGTWYRVMCGRSATTVTLTVVRLADDATWTYSDSGPIGSLRAPAAQPLSIGGKVDASGRIVAASDQFNGRVDNAFYAVAG